MATKQITRPVKTREMYNHHTDSTIWNDFACRASDVIVATYGKAGTTWTQQIVTQLVFGGDPSVGLAHSPWLDMRVLPREETLAMLEAQVHRRIVKTHLPLDALTYSPQPKYLYVARDGRDVAWSFHNHLRRLADPFYERLNGPGLVGPPLERPGPDVRQFFREWMDRDGFPAWPFWHHIRSWWEAREVPNIRLVHFNALKRDLPGMIQAIADFLEIEIDAPRRDAIVEHCSFDYMKQNASHIFPMADQAFEGGAKGFIHKGTNQRWKEVLTEEDNRHYLATARRELGDACAHWLETGDM